MKGETPREWTVRNTEQLARSTRETLPPEMWFGIAYQGIGLLFAIVGSIAFFVSIGQLAVGVMVSGFVVFANSMYWTWYIRRGLNRRWEKEMAARVFAEKRADAAFSAPDDRLMGNNRTRDIGEISTKPQIGRSFDD